MGPQWDVSVHSGTPLFLVCSRCPLSTGPPTPRQGHRPQGPRGRGGGGGGTSQHDQAPPPPNLCHPSRRPSCALDLQEKKKNRSLQWAREHYLNHRGLLRAEDVLAQLLELEAQVLPLLKSLPAKCSASLDAAHGASFEIQSEDLQLRKCFAASFFLNAAQYSPAERAYRTVTGRNLVQV